MRRFRILAMAAPGLLLTLLLITSSAVGGKTADVRNQKFAFTATNLLPPTGGFSEPSITLSSKDHVFLCGPNGLGAGNAFVRSADWKSFERFDINDVPISGGDCDIKVGPDDAIYEANLQLFGSAVRKSVLDGVDHPPRRTRPATAASIISCTRTPSSRIGSGSRSIKPTAASSTSGITIFPRRWRSWRSLSTAARRSPSTT
jgi:hypothetical protein